VEIMGNDAGRELQKALEMGNGVRPGTVCALIAKITQMLAEEHFPAPDQSKHALELPATGKDRLCRLVDQGDGQRHIAARAAQDDRGAVDASRHRVVATHLDRPVVSQEEVRDATQPSQGISVLVRNGLVAAVSASHDQWIIDSPKKQMLEGCMRQHQAEMAQPRGHFVGHPLASLRAPLQEHNGPRRGLEKVSFGF
jgi:hypothetical protein